MDRDKRWERVELAYNAMVLSKGEENSISAVEAVEDAFMIIRLMNLFFLQL